MLCSADGPEVKAVEDYEGCHHSVIPFTRAITPVQDLRCLWQLVQFMRRYTPDIVHTHTPKAGLLGMVAARLTGIKVRVHTVAGLPYMTAGGKKRRLLIMMEKITYWAAAHVWPNSQGLYKEIVDQGLCPASKLDIISHGSTNGIDLQQFSSDAISATIDRKIKKDIGYRPDCRYLIVIGRLVRDKGILELLEAFEQLHKALPDVRLLLLGPLEEERAEEILPGDAVRRLKEHPAITHVPWTDEVAVYLRLADLLIHPSHREGFPNVLLQAGAMNCPIICSQIAGNVDIVTHEKTGLTFPAGDAVALLDRMEYALQHHAEMSRMADTLRQQVQQRYDREVIHRCLLHRYQELMNQVD